MIQKIGQIGVTVKNLVDAIHFYKEKLGLTLLFQTDNMAFLIAMVCVYSCLCRKVRSLITRAQRFIFKLRI
ncbi:TPA: VOC family protein [Yersinia enterocolitica]|nr:VOC family protein [Yersinia enterocolitica]